MFLSEVEMTEEKRQNGGGNGSSSDNLKITIAADQLRQGHLVTGAVSLNGVGNGGMSVPFMKKDTGLISRINWDMEMADPGFPRIPVLDYAESKVAEMEKYADNFSCSGFDRYEKLVDGKSEKIVSVKPLPKSDFTILEDIVFKLDGLLKGCTNPESKKKNVRWFPFEGYNLDREGRATEPFSETLNRYVFFGGRDDGHIILPLPYIFNRKTLQEGDFSEENIHGFYYALRYTDNNDDIIPVEASADHVLNHLDNFLQGVDIKDMQKINFVLLHNNEFKFIRQCMNGVPSIIDRAASESDKRDLAIISAQKVRAAALKNMHEDDPSGVKARKIIDYAIKQGASDIHLIPFFDDKEGDAPKCRIAFRIDGHLRQYSSVPIEDGMHMINAIMTATGQTEYKGTRLAPCSADVRLDKWDFPGFIIRGSTMPSFSIVDQKTKETRPTESFSGRIAQVTGAAMTLEKLGLPKYLVNTAKELVKRRDGITYFIGATNTGKTTTLYALIREANPEENVILTLESPIERIIKGVVHSQIGGSEYTLDKGLVAMVRHDPDIILVGEVNNYPTADAAIQAALTGHLVFTTLHARTDYDAIKRLSGLVGLEASKDYLLTMGMTLNCLWAQRLAAKLCSNCKVAEDGRPKFAEILGYDQEEFNRLVPNPFIVYKPGKRLPNGDTCPHCNGYGDKGMQVVSQVLMMNPEIRDMIAHGVYDETRYISAARKIGMLTFPELATLYVRDGTISIDEASDVSPFWEMKEKRDLVIERLNNYDSNWAKSEENPFIFR